MKEPDDATGESAEESGELSGTSDAPEVEDGTTAEKKTSPLDVGLGLLVDVAAVGTVAVLSFATYLFGYLPITASISESRQSAELSDRWSTVGVIDTESDEPAEVFDPYAFSEDYGRGDTFAKMRIPALGDDWEYTIAVGTTLDDLRTSPGWYETTQLPGEPGNFATAAHRDGSNAPYMHMDALEVCDDIIVETEGGLWVYTVLPTDPNSPEQQAQFAECAPNAAREVAETDHYAGLPGQHIVPPTAIETIFPIPGSPLENEYVVPDDAHPLLTMTSCHPRWQNYERIIVHAALERSHARS